MTSPDTPDWTQRVTARHKLLMGITLGLGIALVVVLFFSHRGLYQIYRFRQERVRLEQENARLAAENARLARTIDRLQHDPELIQDLIRRELNFVKKNEIIFQLPPGLGSKAQYPPDSPEAGAPPSNGPQPGAADKAGTKGHSWDFLEGAPGKAAPRGEGSSPPGD